MGTIIWVHSVLNTQRGTCCGVAIGKQISCFRVEIILDGVGLAL